MHYESAVSYQDLLEFQHNSKEVANNLWVSELPSQFESIGYELDGSTLVVKYEQNEDERIAYGDHAYSLNIVPQIIALACAAHKRSFVRLGRSRHTIHVTVNKPDGEFFAVVTGAKTIKHQSRGLIFAKEHDFYMALEDRLVAQLYVDRMGLALGNIIPAAYLVRFEYKGVFHYFPASLVFTDKTIRDSYLTPEQQEFDWDDKRKTIEDFVEEWTK